MGFAPAWRSPMYLSSARRVLLLTMAALIIIAAPVTAQGPPAAGRCGEAATTSSVPRTSSRSPCGTSPISPASSPSKPTAASRFPLIGRVKAGGLTLRQFEAELKKKLADGYFKNPQVSVAVETYRSQRIFIVGEVRNPGHLPAHRRHDAHRGHRAGRVDHARRGPEVVVVRAPAGRAGRRAHPARTSGTTRRRSQRVNLRDLQSGALSQNVALRDGDTIFVPRAESIYVFGQVKNPGAYPLQHAETTVLQALVARGRA